MQGQRWSYKIHGKKIDQSPSGAVRGLFGETKPLNAYSNLLFVTSGNDIRGIYCEANHFAKKDTNNKQSVKLVSNIRELKSLVWFWSELQALRETKIQITIYVTSGTEDLLPMLCICDSEKEEDKFDDYPFLDRIEEEFPHITFVNERWAS